MTHREFLIWLKPRLDCTPATGLARDAIHAIRDELKTMRRAGALQPFASRLYNLVREHSTLDAATVADLADEVRSELAPPREKTMVLLMLSGEHEERS
jgi:hypothetical protein